ncbi:hypothetical protein BT96DRAFT_874505 [Gymnopus androsaceus JB14]|uniref:Tat pathway signal sequence n=1 Tax=Gymnopus androsaceus JB14 TaxID=1447944 RepID=A0A6A4IBX7_9AGAR|nr:hypothetical protein BT96DRAFT_874505 [Gymnopus androsaceus JB14]
MRFPFTGSYHLLSDIGEDDLDESLSIAPREKKYKTDIQFWRTCSVLQSIVIVLGLISYYRKTNGNEIHGVPKRLSYSPATDVVDYDLRVFHSGFHGNYSAYQGFSPEIDQAWKDLYEVGEVTRIPKEQAAQLPNKTVPIPGDKYGSYIGALYVFHDLHCLDQIRQAVFFEHYPESQNRSNPTWEFHISHCIDSLRQTLMCKADISTITWAWEEYRGLIVPQDDTVHQCMKFEHLLEWAKERAISYDKVDRKVHLPDDILIPIYHQNEFE